MNNLVKVAIVILMLGGFIIFSGDIQTLVWQSSLKIIQEQRIFIQQNIFLSIALTSIIYFIAIISCLPIVMLLTILSGALFGFYVLPLLILILASAGLCFALLAKRFIDVTAYSHKFEREISVIEDIFSQSPLIWILAVRTIPLLPYWVGNILVLSVVKKKSVFFIGTLLGVIPATAIYVTLGVGISEVISSQVIGSFEQIKNPAIMGSLFCIFLLASSGVAAKHILRKRREK